MAVNFHYRYMVAEKLDEQRQKIGFLGFGKMAQAIAAGLLEPKKVERDGALDFDLESIAVFDPAFDINKLSFQFPARDRIKPTNVSELENQADIILLCTKPQDLKSAISPLSGKKKYISIAAGVGTSEIQTFFNCSDNVHLARTMPNVAAFSGMSVTGVFSETEEMSLISRKIFDCVGITVQLANEDLMHAVTGLSGSGPAYCFLFAQALAEGAVREGLAMDHAIEMAAMTMKGAADLILQRKTHPAVLKSEVSSPQGTTIEALFSLEKAGFSGLVMDAVHCAAEKSRSLKKGS